MIVQANCVAAPAPRRAKTDRPLFLCESTNDVGRRGYELKNDRGIVLGRYGDPTAAERRARQISKTVVWVN